MSNRRHPSPGRQRFGMDPHRASTGSLHHRPPAESMYYNGAPVAPNPPAPGPPHGHHNRPYSGPHSPQDSTEDLHYAGYAPHPQSVPPTPGYAPQPSPGGGLSGWMGMGPPMPGMMAPAPAPPGPHMAPAPGPPGPPQPGMRGMGMDPHMHNRMNSLGRRNTQNEKPQQRQNVIHQQQHHPQPAPHAPQGYDHGPEYAFRGPPRRGAQTSRSSSRSPSPRPGKPFIVPNQSSGRPQSTAYHSSSSNFSGESYDMNFPVGGPMERQQSYVVPNASHPGNGRDREYHLGGPPPSEFRREGTVYHPNNPRPILGEQQRPRPARRERSRSRGPHHGLGLTDSQASGDGSDDFEEVYRPGARRAASTTEKGALVRARSRSVPASDSRAMIPQSRNRPSSETSESSSGSETHEQTNQSQIRIEYGNQTIDINYSGTRNGKPPIGNITINTTSRSHTLPLNSPINQRAIAAAPARATPPPTTQAIMPPPSSEAAPAPAPAPAPPPPAPEAAPAPPPAPQAPPAPPPPAVMIPPPPQPTPYSLPHGVEPMILPPPPQPGIVPPAPGTILPPRRAGSDGGYDDHDYRDRDLYRMESLSLEGPSSPYRDDHRGRDRDMIPAVGAPRALSRRRRSISRNRKSVDGSEHRWTKISRDIVARRAVEVIGYDFKEQSDSIMVFQVLDEAQIDELIELSNRIRKGEVRVIRRERSTTRDDDKEHRHHRRRSSQHRHSHKSRPNSIHGFPSPGPGPGPSANRPPPGKPALVSPPAVPPAPEPPQAEAPAPPPMRQTSTRRPQENPDQPGTYIGYTRNPPRSTQGSGPYHSRHGNGKRSG